MAFLPIALVNGDAEAGTGYNGDHGGTVIPGWTTTLGAPSVLLWANTSGFPNNGDPGPPAGERGLNYFYGGAANALSILTQTLNLAGHETSVDAGLIRFGLSGYLGGCPAQEDSPTITIDFKNGGGAAIGTASIGPVSNADRGGVNALLLRFTSGAVPAGTRTALVTMTLTRFAGSDNDAYADNIQVLFSDVPLPPSLPVVPPSGGNGSGSGGIGAGSRVQFVRPIGGRVIR